MLTFVSLSAVTKKKYIFFRFPFLEPERQQLSPLLIVTHFYTVVLNGHTVEMLENVGFLFDVTEKKVLIKLVGCFNGRVFRLLKYL
jgi:hypothetical protein